jgi:hypothetical protein
LTIFEMIDLLESEIVGLRARMQELERSVGLSQVPTLKSKPKAKRQRGKTHAKKKRATGRKQSQAKEKKLQQLSFPTIVDGAEKPEERSLGKRQALGKSLTQLRKISIARAQQTG